MDLWSPAFLRRLVRCVDGEDWVVACSTLLKHVEERMKQAVGEEEVAFYRVYAASLEVAMAGDGALDRSLIAATLSEEELAHGAMIEELLDEGVLDG